MPTLTVFGTHQLEPPYSHAAVALVDLTFVALAVFGALAYRKARRAMAEAKAPAGPPREGARFVSGSVEFARDEKAAVKVTVWQRGTEQQGNKSSSHEWVEFDRQTVAAPFYVRCGDKTRVRVEPQGARVVLVDRLDQTHWTKPNERGLRAELSEGERVIAEGELVRAHDPESESDGGPGVGYRDAGVGWVLRPRDGVLHFSTEGLARRHELRAKAFKGTLALVAALFVCAQPMLVTYYARTFAGVDVLAEYRGREFWTSRDSKGRTSLHHGVRVEWLTADGFRQARLEEISRADYNRMPPNYAGGPQPEPEAPGSFPPPVSPPPSEVVHVPLRVVPGFPSMFALGTSSSVFGALIGSAALLAAIAAWRIATVHRYRRWYEGTLRQSGSGLLGSPTGSLFDDERPEPGKTRAERKAERKAARKSKG